MGVHTSKVGITQPAKVMFLRKEKDETYTVNISINFLQSMTYRQFASNIFGALPKVLPVDSKTFTNIERVDRVKGRQRVDSTDIFTLNSDLLEVCVFGNANELFVSTFGNK